MKKIGAAVGPMPSVFKVTISVAFLACAVVVGIAAPRASVSVQLWPAAGVALSCFVLSIVCLTSALARRIRTLEEAARQDKEFLTQVEQIGSIGSFIWQLESQRLSGSEQFFWIFGLQSKTPLFREQIASRIHPEDLPLFDEMTASVRTGLPLAGELRLRMPDQSIKYIQMVLLAKRVRQGNVEYAGAVQDISAHRRCEDALTKVRSELAHMARVTSLGALTASIAHEINQPLSGLVMNANTCLRMLESQPPNLIGARETALRIIRDSNRASDVVARLRALFAKEVQEIHPVDLNRAALEMIELLSTELQGRRVQVLPQLAADLPLVIGDRVQLQQVILNLLSNAMDAMSEIEDRPRTLVVRTQCEAQCVRLTVKDVGIGLDSQNIDRIFEAFYTTKRSGIGMGLSVSRAIVESHRGHLWGEANVGPGASFAMAIPIAQSKKMRTVELSAQG